MHFSINPEDIESGIEKLGHTVTNIYNIKHHLTKLPLPMFFVDLKPATNNKTYLMLNTFIGARLNLSLPNKKEILLNVLAVRVMATQK
jgi:hypothetical protein